MIHDNGKFSGVDGTYIYCIRERIMGGEDVINAKQIHNDSCNWCLR